jgi:hypothetical protein
MRRRRNCSSSKPVLKLLLELKVHTKRKFLLSCFFVRCFVFEIFELVWYTCHGSYVTKSIISCQNNLYILAIIKQNRTLEVYCAFVLFYNIKYLDSLVISFHNNKNIYCNIFSNWTHYGYFWRRNLDTYIKLIEISRKRSNRTKNCQRRYSIVFIVIWNKAIIKVCVSYAL